MKLKTAIVGIGETEVGNIPGVSPLEFQVKASLRALEDCGLKADQVDGLFTSLLSHAPTYMQSAQLAEAMGFKPRITSCVDVGGASPCTMLAMASAAVISGLCNVVLCVLGQDDASSRGKVNGVGTLKGEEEFLAPHGMGAAPIWYAMVAKTHMEIYGTKPEQLAAIAVACRRHASQNENAQMRQPITVEDVLSSRYIAEPLHLLDCCLNSDGGGAFLVTSAERACDLKKPPVFILGIGGCHTHHRGLTQAPDYPALGVQTAGREAYAMAGLSPADVDLAEIYDCFTIAVLAQLEHLGFCELGEGGSFVEEGRIELGGELPVNTHGGLLSQAHLDGMLHVTEAVRQLRGECGPRQVEDAEVALVTGNGGVFSTAMAALMGNETN